MRSLVRFTGVVAVLTVSSCGKDATAPGVHPGGLIPDSPWRARAPRMRQPVAAPGLLPAVANQVDAEQHARNCQRRQPDVGDSVQCAWLAVTHGQRAREEPA